jgi:hypothetical protein
LHVINLVFSLFNAFFSGSTGEWPWGLVFPKYFTTQATFQVLWLLVSGRVWCFCLDGFRPGSSYLCVPCSWDCRCVSPSLAFFFNFSFSVFFV